MCCSPSSRPAFSLIEVMIALVLVTIVFVAIQASALLTLRRLTDSSRDVLAARIVANRAEQIFALPCHAQHGTARINGILTSWVVTTASGIAYIQQRAQYQSANGLQLRSYTTAGGCQ